jgi:RNA polymerase sigma factor (sigma-70 family)
MNEPARLPRRHHSLMADRPRLDKIADAMSVQIQKVIYGRRVTSEVERALSGGESVDDVLQEALLGLLNADPDGVRETWEALGVRIAHNKAVDAVRRATKGRRRAGADPDAPDELAAVSLDAADLDLRDEGDGSDPEQRFMLYQQELVLLRLARDRLDEREQLVYFGIHFQGRTRAELAGEVGLSPQGVGQMYVRIAKALDAEACRDPSFPTTRIPEGRTE